jgi:hypothetical protein
MKLDLSVIQKDLSRIEEALSEGLSRLKYGSFSDRTPHLGKMRTCVHCHKRSREFSPERCCDPVHTSEIRDRKVEGVVKIACQPRTAEFSMKKLIKKMEAKHHSNKRRKFEHDLALELQDETRREITNNVLRGLPGFHEPSRSVGLADIPAFAQEVRVSIAKHRSNRRRKAQQDARRINFGLKAGRRG